LNSFSNGIIKNLFLNVNRQRGMEALTLILSRGVEREIKGKRFNSTPHFGSLPQGERRDGRKKFKSTPHPNPLPQSGEE
jgi:hypothetical protein